MFKCHFKFVYYTLAHYLYNICMHCNKGALMSYMSVFCHIVNFVNM
jgi:hypothetical protein